MPCTLTPKQHGQDAQGCLSKGACGCRAGLYKQMAELKALVSEYREDPSANAALKVWPHALPAQQLLLQMLSRTQKSASCMVAFLLLKSSAVDGRLVLLIALT